MKKTISFLVILIGFSTITFAQQKYNVPQCIQDLKSNITSNIGDYSKRVKSYSVTAAGRTIEGDFEKYSMQWGIDTTVTDKATFEYFTGSTGKFLIITIVKNGKSKVFVDLDFNGSIDEYIAAGKKITGKKLEKYQHEYEMYLDFGAHG